MNKTLTLIIALVVILSSIFFYKASQSNNLEQEAGDAQRAQKDTNSPEAGQTGNGDASSEATATQATVEEDPTQNIDFEKRRTMMEPGKKDARFDRRENGKILYTPSIASSKKLEKAQTAEEQIGVLQEILKHCHYLYKQHPTGADNADITKYLTGDNPKNVVFIPKDSSAIVAGQIVDTWGAPYFFHSQSSDKTVIKSAGPDKKLWNDDDITL